MFSENLTKKCELHRFQITDGVRCRPTYLRARKAAADLGLGARPSFQPGVWAVRGRLTRFSQCRSRPPASQLSPRSTLMVDLRPLPISSPGQAGGGAETTRSIGAATVTNWMEWGINNGDDDVYVFLRK